MGTCGEAGSGDGGAKSPIVGIGDEGREGLGSWGQEVGRHSQPPPRASDIRNNHSLSLIYIEAIFNFY